jgi:hypothetical protein
MTPAVKYNNSQLRGPEQSFDECSNQSNRGKVEKYLGPTAVVNEERRKQSPPLPCGYTTRNTLQRR